MEREVRRGSWRPGRGREGGGREEEEREVDSGAPKRVRSISSSALCALPREDFRVNRSQRGRRLLPEVEERLF